jgi:FkbM family methyltransferase
MVFHNRRSGSEILLFGRGMLHVDKSDNRGKYLLQCGGVTQPHVALLWRALIKRLVPSLVLDVGTNYGEIALGCRYAPSTKLCLFEPNPYILPFLKQSIDSHLDRERIILFEQAAADNRTEVDFYLDRKWSGTSSAAGELRDPTNTFKGTTEETFECIRVSTVTLDDVVSSAGLDCQSESIVFKIDAEGYEKKILDGFSKTLAKAKIFAGIIEFNRRALQQASTDPDDFLKYLQSLGTVQRVRGRRLVAVENLDSSIAQIDLLVSNPTAFTSGRLEISHALFH